MNLSSKILSDLIIHMKYARFLPSKKRRETWEELIDRNRKMHQKKYPALKKEIAEAFQFVYEKKVLPSMRSLQFGGKPIEISPSRIYNCCYAPIDDWQVFSEVMFLLLGGSGVGYSVQKHHVERLPVVRKPLKRGRRYLIGDSIEGWADAIKMLMKAYFFGKSDPQFDFSDIRPKGTRLVTSGGKAPGPQPLKDCIHNIRKVLDSKESGEKLCPLEAHDIVCHIADAVLSGGIRRAALISLFSFDDEQMMTCKYGSWWELNPQRARANNSAVLLRHRIRETEFYDLWEKMEMSGCGEPAFYFTNDMEMGTNPCGEVALRNNQFCVSGQTKLITKTGIYNIKNAVGQNIEIWNGSEWSKVCPYQTGEDDVLYRVSFTDGSFLDVTANHKFLAKLPWQKYFTEWETLDLIEKINQQNTTVKKLKFQLPRPNMQLSNDIGKHKEFAYEYGFFLGDGHIDNKQLKINLYNQDKHLGLRGRLMPRDYFNWNGTHYLQLDMNVLEFDLGVKLKAPGGLPKEIFSWSRESILCFFGGWIDADGSQANLGCRIYGNEENIRSGQLLLTKVGVNSSVNLMEEAGVHTNLGTRKNAVWYLQIPDARGLESRRLELSKGREVLGKGKYQLIKSIKRLPGRHKSFCLTENQLHQCVFNNVLTKQCNLVTINAASVESQEDLEERATAASFIGTLQAGYTNFHYLRDIWQQQTEKEALLGISLTGIASNRLQGLNLKQAVAIALTENKRVANLMGIRHAARVTAIKPEGTSSLVLGTSSGIHAWYNDFYLRRLRVNKDEPVYLYLKEKFPELLEDDFEKPHLGSVISIPIKAPEGATLRKESALSLLKRIKYMNRHWIRPGHIRGNNRHNVSATVSVKENEWDRVGRWAWENRDYFNGLTVIPYDGGNYVQMPLEDVDEEEYKKLVKYLREIKLSEIEEAEDRTTLSETLACGPGGCEISNL